MRTRARNRLAWIILAASFALPTRLTGTGARIERALPKPGLSPSGAWPPAPAESATRTLSPLPQAPAQSAVDRYNVVWDSPSADYHGSMPVGNGDIGLNAWVEKGGDLLFYISKTDAWDDYARLVKVGKVRIRLEPNPLGALSPFVQTLSLADGSIRVRAGEGESRVEVLLWVDANNPVIHVRVDSPTPCTATAIVELWRTKPFDIADLTVSDVLVGKPLPAGTKPVMRIEPDTMIAGFGDRIIGWLHRNRKSVGPELLANVQGLAGFKQPDPLLHRTFGVVIASGMAGRRLDDARLLSTSGKVHLFDVFVLTKHPSSENEWRLEMDRLIARIYRESLASRRSAHIAWWREFWDRSWIRASAPGAADGGEAALVSQMYHLQRFVTACAGRGAYPIKFNGSIFTVPPADGKGDADYRRWGPGYWWQNTRLPYISLPTAGDLDLMKPLFKMYADDLLELCKHRTRLYTGHEGAFYPECIMFWGPIFSETYGWPPFEEREDKLQQSGWHKWEWVGGLELAWMMLDDYEHTLDDAFLAKTALPFAREILTFFDRHYRTDEKGLLVMEPAQALETWWKCVNPMPEVAGCRAVAERLLTLPAEKTAETEREFWRRLLAKLPPIPVREVNGRTALAPAETFADKKNVENPELYAVFPFRLIALGRPHLDWGIEALALRTDKGHFGWRQDDIFMAYLGLTDDARRAVVERAKNHDPNSRFPAFWGPNYDWVPDQDHGGVLMKAVQAMLMQTDGRKIFLFPAWPKDWDVEFKLHAPFQTIVEGVFRDGRIQSLRVTPESRRADVVMPNGSR
jgi:hypothetical protein